MKDFIGFCEDRKRELLKSIEPDPGSEDCGGTGVITSSDNPAVREILLVAAQAVDEPES